MNLPIRANRSLTCIKVPIGMALSTNDNKTLIDSNQIYSKEAQDVKFHQSILERLFDHCLKNRCHRHILLTSNYRTHENILAFLSKVRISVLYYPNGIDLFIQRISDNIRSVQIEIHQKSELHGGGAMRSIIPFAGFK